MTTAFKPGDGLEFKPATPADKFYALLAVDDYEHVGGSSSPNTIDDANVLTHTSDYSNPGYDLELVGDIEGVSLSTLDATGELNENHLARVSDGQCRVLASHPLISRVYSYDMTQEDPYEYNTLVSFASGSLAKHIYDGMLALIGAHTADDKSLFSLQNHTAPSYTRNVNCWAAPLNLTGMSPWNSRGSATRSGCAITPRHIILAKHYPLSASDTIRFVAADNSVVTRTIADTTLLAESAYLEKDTQVCLLDSDLPASITPFKFLPADVDDYLPALDHWNLPALAFDSQEYALCVETFAKYWTISPITAGQFTQPTTNPFLTMSESIVDGDSGNPIFLVVNNAPVLLSHWTHANGGPKYHTFLDLLASALTTLGGGHSLQTVDLSSFTDYS